MSTPARFDFVMTCTVLYIDRIRIRNQIQIQIYRQRYGSGTAVILTAVSSYINGRQQNFFDTPKGSCEAGTTLTNSDRVSFRDCVKKIGFFTK